jgi:predicted MFS family arabinose efflux permease
MKKNKENKAKKDSLLPIIIYSSLFLIIGIPLIQFLCKVTGGIPWRIAVSVIIAYSIIIWLAESWMKVSREEKKKSKEDGDIFDDVFSGQAGENDRKWNKP